MQTSLKAHFKMRMDTQAAAQCSTVSFLCDTARIPVDPHSAFKIFKLFSNNRLMLTVLRSLFFMITLRRASFFDRHNTRANTDVASHSGFFLHTLLSPPPRLMLLDIMLLVSNQLCFLGPGPDTDVCSMHLRVQAAFLCLLCHAFAYTICRRWAG
jgi:hypothetical protein